MKNGLLFLLKASLIALALFACMPWLTPIYWKVMIKVGNLYFDNGERLTPYLDSVSKIIPFVALLLATPKMPWLRKAVMLTAGLAVFVAIDVGSFFFSTPTDYKQTGVYNTPPNLIYSMYWELYGRWLLPLILWILTSYKYLAGLFRLGMIKEELVKNS